MTNWWLGDSIGSGGWLPVPARDCPMGRMNLRLQAAGRPVFTNASRGGVPIRVPGDGVNPDVPSTGTNRGQLLAQELIAPTAQDGDVIFVAMGANDIGTHKLASEIQGPPTWNAGFVDYLTWSMNSLDTYLRGLVGPAGKVYWQTILPVCPPTQCTEPLPPGLARGGAGPTVPAAAIQYDNWVPALTARIRYLNAWLTAKAAQSPLWAGRVVDMYAALRADANGTGDPRLYLDGLHPTQWGSMRIADAVPLTITGS